MTIKDYDSTSAPAKILCASKPVVLVNGEDVADDLRSAGILEFSDSIFGDLFGDFLAPALVAMDVPLEV